MAAATAHQLLASNRLLVEGAAAGGWARLVEPPSWL
jgi:hypothetical protein